MESRGSGRTVLSRVASTVVRRPPLVRLGVDVGPSAQQLLDHRSMAGGGGPVECSVAVPPLRRSCDIDASAKRSLDLDQIATICGVVQYGQLVVALRRAGRAPRCGTLWVEWCPHRCAAAAGGGPCPQRGRAHADQAVRVQVLAGRRAQMVRGADGHAEPVRGAGVRGPRDSHPDAAGGPTPVVKQLHGLDGPSPGLRARVPRQGTLDAAGADREVAPDVLVAAAHLDRGRRRAHVEVQRLARLLARLAQPRAAHALRLRLRLLDRGRRPDRGQQRWRRGRHHLRGVADFQPLLHDPVAVRRWP